MSAAVQVCLKKDYGQSLSFIEILIQVIFATDRIQ